MKNFIFSLILIIFLSSTVYSKDYVIAVIPKGSTHVFWKEVEKGSLKAAKKLEVKVIFRGPKYDDDINSQIKLVEYFTETDVDAIVIAPTHKTKLIPALKKAKEKGIKIIIIDSALDADIYESFISTNNFEAGKMIGKKLSKLIGNTESVGIIRYNKGNSSTDMREAGFIETMKEEGIPITIDEYGGATIGTTYRTGLDILETHPDVKAFFTPNETSTIGMKMALEKLEMPGDYILAGFDISKEIHDGLENGIINFVVVQQPQLIGYLGVETAVKVLNEEEVEKRIFVDVSIFKK